MEPGDPLNPANAAGLYYGHDIVPAQQYQLTFAGQFFFIGQYLF